VPRHLVDLAGRIRLRRRETVVAVGSFARQLAWIEVASGRIFDHAVFDAVAHVARVQRGRMDRRQLFVGDEVRRGPVRRLVQPHLCDAVACPVVREVHGHGCIEIRGPLLDHGHDVPGTAAAALVHHRETRTTSIELRTDAPGVLDACVKRKHLQVLELLGMLDREAGARKALDAQIRPNSRAAMPQDLAHSPERDRTAPEGASRGLNLSIPALRGHPHFELHVRIHGFGRRRDAAEGGQVRPWRRNRATTRGRRGVRASGNALHRRDRRVRQGQLRERFARACRWRLRRSLRAGCGTERRYHGERQGDAPI
jgi:hypothetical protein